MLPTFDTYRKAYIIDTHDTLLFQVLIFPSHDCINVHGIFDNHIKLEKGERFKNDRGFNEGTLLKHRLDEVEEDDPESTYQNTGALREEQVPQYTQNNLPIKRAVFIDSTWNQSRSIYKDPRLNTLQTVVIQNRLSQFWRHQKNCPRWYLATIEGMSYISMALIHGLI